MPSLPPVLQQRPQHPTRPPPPPPPTTPPPQSVRFRPDRSKPTPALKPYQLRSKIGKRVSCGSASSFEPKTDQTYEEKAK